MKTRAI